MGVCITRQRASSAAAGPSARSRDDELFLVTSAPAMRENPEGKAY